MGAGRGAYVLSGGWDDEVRGTPYVIDAKGTGYPLVGDSVAERLGYAAIDAPVVPRAWVELLDEGVALSVASVTWRDCGRIGRAVRAVGGLEVLSELDPMARTALFADSWPLMWGVRNRIAHGCLLVNATIVRRTIEDDVPPIVATIRRALG